jgi:hypothetical protein
MYSSSLGRLVRASVVKPQQQGQQRRRSKQQMVNTRVRSMHCPDAHIGSTHILHHSWVCVAERLPLELSRPCASTGSWPGEEASVQSTVPLTTGSTIGGK